MIFSLDMNSEPQKQVLSLCHLVKPDFLLQTNSVKENTKFAVLDTFLNHLIHWPELKILGQFSGKQPGPWLLLMSGFTKT